MKILLFLISFLPFTIWAQAISFDPQRGLVEVKVILDGQVKGTFGIDTGADRLYIDKTFAQENQLTFRQPIPQRKIVGLEGTSKAYAVSLRSLRIGGDISLYNLRATAIDIRQLVNDSTGNIPDGLIGYEILRRFYVKVNYPQRKMELLSFEPDFLRGKRYFTIPFKQYQHLILVNVTFPNDMTASMILDYCASQTTINSSLAKKLGINSEKSENVIVSEMTLGESVTSKNVPVLIRDYPQFKKSVARAQFDGVLGYSFLSHYVITVDYKRHRIYVHKP